MVGELFDSAADAARHQDADQHAHHRDDHGEQHRSDVLDFPHQERGERADRRERSNNEASELRAHLAGHTEVLCKAFALRNYELSGSLAGWRDS
jgi:hypothetical protein